MVPAPRDRLLFSFLTLFVTALACGQAIPAQSGGQPPTSTSPRAEDQTPIEASVAGAPILIGTEYIIIEVPSRVAPWPACWNRLALPPPNPYLLILTGGQCRPRRMRKSTSRAWITS